MSLKTLGKNDETQLFCYLLTRITISSSSAGQIKKTQRVAYGARAVVCPCPPPPMVYVLGVVLTFFPISAKSHKGAMESIKSFKFLRFEDNRENSARLCGWTYIDVPQWERNRHWGTWLQRHYSLHKKESYAANDFRPFHTSQHKYSPDPWFSCSWWSACSETQAWICSQPQSLDRKTPTNNSINR